MSRPGTTAGLEIKPEVNSDVPLFEGSELRQTFVVTNSGTAAAAIELGDVRSTSGAPVSSTWLDVGSNQRVSKFYAAPAKSRLLLSVSAPAPEGGRYRTSITARIGDERYVYAFPIQRRTRLPESGVFTARKEPAHADTRFLPFLEREARVAFNVQNTGAATVQIRQPFIRAANHTVGGRVQQVNLGASEGLVTCGSDGSTDSETMRETATKRAAPVVLPSGRICAGAVSALIRWPGAYILSVSANGAGPDDGQASVDILLNVRAHLIWAILLAALGAVVGSLVSRWQTQGRAKAMAQLAIAIENERIGDLNKAAKGFGYRAPVAGVVAELESLWERIDADPQVDLAAPLNGIRAHLDLIRRWVELLDDIQSLPVATRKVLGAEAVEVADLLTPRNPPVDGLNAALDGLAARVRRAQTDPPLQPTDMSVVSSMIPRPGDFRRMARRVKHPARQIAGFVKRTDIMVDILLGVGVCTAAIMTSWLTNATWGGIGDMVALVTATFTVQTGGVFLARPNPASVQ